MKYFRNIRNYLQNELISERTREWFFWKGFGGFASVAVAILVAYFAYKTLDLSNSARLNEVLNETRSQLDQHKHRADSLQLIVSNYNSKRFMIHKEESRILFNDVYFRFFGDRGARYSIVKFDSVLIRETGLSLSIPHTFTVYNQKYFIKGERFFLNKTICDSAIVYCDSLRQE